MSGKVEEQRGDLVQHGLKEARYSLAELLAEVQMEQQNSAFGQEMVDQDEIVKLFARKKRKRRGNASE